MAYDYGGYERAKGDIDYKYTNEAATNAYGRFLSQQRGQRNLGDMTRSFQRSFPRQKSQFGARGLAGSGAQSGVMKRSMNNYIGDYGRQYGRTQQDITQGLQQYDLGQMNLDEWRNRALTDLETDKANEIATTAQNLEQWRQIMGGL